jgi:hypothetical protein
MNYLIEHSVDPDKRRYSVKGEAECHFLDVDRYVTETSSSPFENLPERWNDAVSKFGEDSLRAWHCSLESVFRLFKIGEGIC